MLPRASTVKSSPAPRRKGGWAKCPARARPGPPAPQLHRRLGIAASLGTHSYLKDARFVVETRTAIVSERCRADIDLGSFSEAMSVRRETLPAGGLMRKERVYLALPTSGINRQTYPRGSRVPQPREVDVLWVSFAD